MTDLGDLKEANGCLDLIERYVRIVRTYRQCINSCTDPTSNIAKFAIELDKKRQEIHNEILERLGLTRDDKELAILLAELCEGADFKGGG